jgi:hypothetical protein
MTPPEVEILRRRKARNRAVFGALLAFVVIVYFVTITKIKTGGAP